MTTTDKILLGLSCHARSDCSGCPYEDQPECSSKLAEDAEMLYKQLERERDAAVEELKVYKFCTACKHDKDNLDANENSQCFGCSSKSN